MGEGCDRGPTACYYRLPRPAAEGTPFGQSRAQGGIGGFRVGVVLPFLARGLWGIPGVVVFRAGVAVGGEGVGRHGIDSSEVACRRVDPNKTPSMRTACRWP